MISAQSIAALEERKLEYVLGVRERSRRVTAWGAIARAASFWVGSTAVDSSKSRPSRDVDRSAGSTDSGRSRD
jgi:hypothetical protein